MGLGSTRCYDHAFCFAINLTSFYSPLHENIYPISIIMYYTKLLFPTPSFNVDSLRTAYAIYHVQYYANNQSNILSPTDLLFLVFSIPTRKDISGGLRHEWHADFIGLKPGP